MSTTIPLKRSEKNLNVPAFVSLAALIVGSVVNGCSSPDHAMNGDNVIISNPGLYQVTRLAYSIRVEVTPEHLVRYTVSDASNRPLITSVERFSARQRWCIFWDQKDRLWVASSDIGTFLWRKTESEEYRQTPVVNDEILIRQMPVEVFDHLPNAMKTRWRVYR